MNIKDNSVLRQYRLRYPKNMHLAIESAFLNGFVVGIRQERHKQGELERFLKKIGLTMADYKKYGGEV